MKSLIFAGAAALALTATPALADDHMDAMELTATQQAMYDAWTDSQRTTYDAWPMEAQTYYWTLDDMQQGVWWNALNNEQRVRIVGMDDAQRVAAWTSIRNQMNAAGNATASNASATARTTRSATSGNIVFRGNAVTQTAPAAHNGEYPPCKGDQQDNCVNPREAGLNYGNRPLNYWPGKPASEIDGPLPQNR